MGQRANLVLTDEKDYQLFYCHWCANSITQNVFWGPQSTIAYIQQQRSVPKTEWLDDVWAEGGVVVDVSQRHMLIYGGEDILWDLPLRRLYMALMDEVWQGWSIEWAHQGIVDMAAYLSLDLALVRSRNWAEDIRVPTFELKDSRHGYLTFGSIRTQDNQLSVYPFRNRLLDFLALGSQLLPRMKALPLGHEKTIFGENNFPSGGFHIDEQSKRIFYWSIFEPDHADELRQLWEGWNIESLQDRFEEHFRVTSEYVLFNSKTIDEHIKELENLLVRNPHASGANTLQKIIDDETSKGKDIQVNPYAMRDDPLKLDLAIKKAIFDRAVAAWRQKQGSNL